ncbi:MAG: phytoene/squalene synthase family protein [Candidatus Hermodarchaeota archaeon]
MSSCDPLKFKLLDLIKEFDSSSLDLDSCYDYCIEYFKFHAKSFYFASRFLEPEVRRQIAALYAFCRFTDDLVDESYLQPNEIASELDKLKEIILRLKKGEVIPHPIFFAFRDTLLRHHIPVKYLHELVEGVRMDLTIKEVKTVDELQLYCYRVASVVGIMMCHIFGVSVPETLNRAADLGVAMQLTNILRDVGKDFNMGRIYLPREIREKFNVKVDDFKINDVSSNLRTLLKHQIAEARRWYKSAERGIDSLPPAAAFTIRVASRVYGGILKAIEKIDYQVLKHRAFVPKWRKIKILVGLYLRYKFLRTRTKPRKVGKNNE